MGLDTLFRDLIVGKNHFISSYGEFKRAMLSGKIALMGIFLCVFYFFFDFAFLRTDILFIYGLAVAALTSSIHFHRKGRHRLANCILLPTINLTVYVFAAAESPNTGTFIFFISNAVAAFAVFSYKERVLSILFSIFTYVLFVVAYFLELSLLPKRDYSQDMLLLNVVINFTFALPATVMSVYLLITLNHHHGMELVERNHELNKTNAELDRFVYSTSHDLRAPLTSLMGLINITQDTTDPKDINKYLVMMKDRIHSLDKFIKDITDYSRNNRLEITHESIRMEELALEVWDSLKFAPEARRISFEVNISHDVTVGSDKNRLKVIMSNLISNAIRYHDERKPDQFIRLFVEVRDRNFYLKVEDNGQGIAHEYHTRIFDMFYRANEKSKGSGLGLYIVKEALSKLSGSIHLESAPGIGSTFTVRLPNHV
jgi:signal transduction histidine kinase